MKKLISAGLAAMISLTAFAGCGSESSESEGFTPSMDKEASAVINISGSWSNFEAIEAAAADWNEIYPNVTVNYSKVDGYTDQLEAVVTSDDPPEMVMFGADNYYVGKENIIPKLVDLSAIGMDTSVYSDSLIDASTVDGKLCVFNWGMLTSGFAVNMTLLESLGLEVPKTHDEMDKVCDELVAQGYVPIQGCTQSFYKNLMKNDRDYHIAYSEDKNAALENLKKGEGSGRLFDAEFTAIFEMVEKGYISPAVNDEYEDIYESSILRFFEGNVPFMAFTTEGFSGMKKRETKSEKFTSSPFEYEFVSLPISTDEPALSISSFGGLSIVQGSKNEEWAKEFVRFLCSSEEINKMAETKGVPSVISSSDKRFDMLVAIPENRRIDPAFVSDLSFTDESFSSTLCVIATGEVKTVEEAEKYYEERLVLLGAVEG